MKLLPLESATMPLAAGWLARKENYQWLDINPGGRILTPQALALMNAHHDHVLRLYAPDDGEPPVGLVALSDLSAAHRTATLWCVLGDKRVAGRGYTTRAVTAMLSHAFGELGLWAVRAWAVEANTPATRVLERNGFKRAGRLRQCHEIDGRLRDRLLFDRLAWEGVTAAPVLPDHARALRSRPGVLAEWQP